MTSLLATRSTNSRTGVVLGRVEPRIYTLPFRDLSDPASSWGYDFVDFCELIGQKLDPWQEWLAIHLGELLPDGSPRYRKAIILVARQNGKSVFAKLLTAYWMFVERVPLVYGTHKDLASALKAWKEVIALAEDNPLLAEALPTIHTLKSTGREDFWNSYGSHYKFGAPNGNAARGDTVHRALIDELRQQTNRECWDSIVPATNAVGDPLVLCITNEGDASAIVLHEEYDAALSYIETGEGDEATFLAAWSSPSDSDPLDLEALAYANPSLNRIRENGTGLRDVALLGQAHAAVKSGGDTLAGFKTEMMCIRVDQLEAAIRPEDWSACGRPDDMVDLTQHRGRLALCFDVSQDGGHATLSAAAVVDGKTYVRPVASWDGYECRKELRRDLPGWVEKIKPRKVTWFPGGPAAAVAAEFPGRRVGGVRIEEIRAEDVVRACMGLEEQAVARDLVHAHDPLYDLQVKQAQRLAQGDGWRFMRRGQNPIDAIYSAAGAAHVARTVPASVPFESA